MGINYSLIEHKVGTWIDGSDLYEKTYVITTADLTNDGDYEMNDYSIDKIVHIESLAVDNSVIPYGAITMLNYGYNANTRVAI